MKTKTIAVIAAFSLLPVIGFAQPPAPPNPPNPPNAPNPPIPPVPPRDRDRDKGPKVPVTFLGVETSEVPRVVSEQLGLAKGFGLVVDYVVPDGPAAAAGVQQSDILKMLNDQILVQPDQLAKLIRSYPEGTNVVLTILRKGAETKITVKLAKKEVSSHQNFFGPDPGKDRHRHDQDFGMLNHDLENMNFDFSAMENIGPSIREAVTDARREALRATAEARREALRASGDARREALRATEEARRAARQLHLFSTDNGAMKSTTIDLGKAQIVCTDPHGEMKIETVNGKKMLTAKDAQGLLLFSGPVDSKEELDKVPAEVRQRYDKLEQKDLPGVISTASIDKEDDADNDSGDEDADQDADGDDSNDSPDASMQQVSYQAPPRFFQMFTVTSI
jgi:PDZ domain-containing protein